MKVLILHPELKNQGGVSNYFRNLGKRFEVQLDHFTNGKRIHERGFFKFFIRLLWDYVLFIQKLLKGSFDVIHINPSLNLKGIMRDGVFVLLSPASLMTLLSRRNVL